MRQKVDLHGLFAVVFTPLGIFQGWLVDTSVANESVNGLGHAKFIDIFAELADRFERVEFTFHGSKVVQVKTIDFGNRFHLVEIADGSDDVVFAGTKKRQGGFSSEAGGRSRNDDKF